MPFQNQPVGRASLPAAIAYEDEANTFTLAGGLNASTQHQVAGTKVLGAQGAAVADVPAGGVGTAAGGWDTAANRDAAIASINALLARLRAATGHGLIA